MSLLERIYYLHTRIQENRYPNSGDLVREFEISAATAHRDINYLRDRLLAPLAFDQRKNGYFYTDSGFNLPFADTPRLVLLLGLLQKLGEETGLTNLPELRQLQNKISSLVSSDMPVLDELVHCEWIETETLVPAVFNEVLNSLVTGTRLRIIYRRPDGSESSREVDPLRLVNYQGRWYILAWCLQRNARRLFHLARIIEATKTGIKSAHVLAPGDNWLSSSFGIFKGEPADRYWAEILFTGTASEIVRHQRWHPEQQITETPEGLRLSLPITDDRELLMKVLQFGSQARILSPSPLRLKLRDEITTMSELYNSPE